MVEEYSLDTGVLLRRAWKRNKELRGEAVWDIEVGDSIPDVAVADDGAFLMRESNTEVCMQFFTGKWESHAYTNILNLALPNKASDETEYRMAYTELTVSPGNVPGDG